MLTLTHVLLVILVGVTIVTIIDRQSNWIEYIVAVKQTIQLLFFASLLYNCVCG